MTIPNRTMADEHKLLHLQSMRRALELKDYKQVEFDIYEMGQHLGFSPKEINNDTN